MKHKLSVFLVLVAIVFAGCEANITKYDTLYDADASEAKSGTIGVRSIEDEEFVLRIRESSPDQEPYVGVFGTDGVNHFHNLKGQTVEEVIRLFLISSQSSNIVFANHSELPKIDLYFESHYVKMAKLSIEEKIGRLVSLLSEILHFTIVKMEIPATVYIFSSTAGSKIEDYYVELDESRYLAGSGLVSTSKDGVISRSNYDEKEYYLSFGDFLANVKCRGETFQYEDHTDSQGVLALPIETLDCDYDEIFELLMEKCMEWGIDVRSEQRIIDTRVITFGG